MLMPKKNREKIYEYLFKEGVCVAKKDFHLKQHPQITGVPNLHVIKAMQSLVSRGYCKEQFAWRHYYWYLTNEGINYLREFLHLPPEIVPATLKRAARPEPARPVGAGAQRPYGDRKFEDEGRRDYRKEIDKQAEVGPGAAPMDFRGGYGRGKMM